MAVFNVNLPPVGPDEDVAVVEGGEIYSQGSAFRTSTTPTR